MRRGRRQITSLRVIFHLLRLTKKNCAEPIKVQHSSNGGEMGIWTPVRVSAVTRFRIVRIQPLCHLSSTRHNRRKNAAENRSFIYNTKIKVLSNNIGLIILQKYFQTRRRPCPRYKIIKISGSEISRVKSRFSPQNIQSGPPRCALWFARNILNRFWFRVRSSFRLPSSYDKKALPFFR